MRAAAAVIAIAAAAAGPALAQEAELVLLPSGLEARLLEVIRGPSSAGQVYRFRFVAEGFAPSEANVDMVQADLQHLCDAYALERLPGMGPQPAQIIISLADRPGEFGIADPAVRQVFEAYSPEVGACIWEMF